MSSRTEHKLVLKGTEIKKTILTNNTVQLQRLSIFIKSKIKQQHICGGFSRFLYMYFKAKTSHHDTLSDKLPGKTAPVFTTPNNEEGFV